MTEIFFVVAIIVVLGIAFVVLSRRSGEAAPDDSARDPEMEDGVVSEPVPVPATATRPTVVKEEVEVATAPGAGTRWAKQFEPRSGTLDNAARLKLITDLGMLRAAWCVPLLEQACGEEPDPGNRAAAHAALARCRDAATSRS
jgi:hypothetical protein